jgi:hypothetical protein
MRHIMSISGLLRKRHLICFALVSVIQAAAPGRASAGVSTFEQFTEGRTFTGSFTDPASGITFSNSSSNTFTVEFGAATPEFPGVLPGKYIEGGGFVPGPLTSFLVGFGFTATFPKPASHVSLDALYSASNVPPATISVQAFDAAGNLLATEQQNVPTFLVGAVRRFDFESATPEIQSIRVSAPGVASGYDNISALVPLPSALSAGIMVITAIMIVGGLRVRRAQAGLRN